MDEKRLEEIEQLYTTGNLYDSDEVPYTISEMIAEIRRLSAEHDALREAMKELLTEYESGRWLKMPSIIRNALGIEWKPLAKTQPTSRLRAKG